MSTTAVVTFGAVLGGLVGGGLGFIARESVMFGYKASVNDLLNAGLDNSFAQDALLKVTVGTIAGAFIGAFLLLITARLMHSR